MNTHTSTEPVDSEDRQSIPSDAHGKSESENSAPGHEPPGHEPTEHEPTEHEPTEKVSRFRQIYRKYRAKGKWFVVGFFLFYLIRDSILYIIIPWYLAKGGMSFFDWLFGN